MISLKNCGKLRRDIIKFYKKYVFRNFIIIGDNTKLMKQLLFCL